MIDLRTFALVLIITHFIQIIVFTYQFIIIKNYHGIGYWLLWSVAEVIGFSFLLLRQIPQIQTISIIMQNSMIVLGVIFLYIGTIRFFDKKVNYWFIFGIYLTFLFPLIYFTLIYDNMWIRGNIFNITLTFISFLTAYSLFFWRHPSVKTSANFNGVFFILHGCFFVFRTILTLKNKTYVQPFILAPINIYTYIDALIYSIVWTYVLIIMINQRLNADMKEAKEQMELIFNTTPDSAMISRLSDGMFTNVMKHLPYFQVLLKKNLLVKQV